MNRVLLIDGNLVFPPSSTSCFRDVTLYANVFKEIDVVVRIESQFKDTCYDYLKQHGAFDFVEDIIEPREPEPGVIISDSEPYHIRARKFWAGNLNRIINEIMWRF